MSTILILGGAGFYGRHLIDDVRARTDADMIVVDRRAAPELAGTRIHCVAGDIEDETVIRPLVRAADVVVQVAGPFSRYPVVPLRLALREARPYLDISEDLGWQQLVEDIVAGHANPPPVAIGASVVPALMLSAVEHLSREFDQVTEIRVVGGPDARGRRGPGTYHTMLATAGRPFLAPRNGRMQPLRGWSEPEPVEFPPPVGHRTAYLVAGRADRDQLRRRYGVVNAEFKAALASPWLNRMMTMAAGAGRVSTRLPLHRLTPVAQAASWLVGWRSSTGGAVIVEVGGIRDGEFATDRLGIVAETGCGRIPIAPLAVEVGRLVRGVSLLRPGVVDEWMPWTELSGELQSRGLEIYRRSDEHPWSRIGGPVPAAATD